MAARKVALVKPEPIEEPRVRHESKAEAPAIKSRPLYRSVDNKVIAGVAGGMGEFFGIDPTIIRIIFVLLALSGGAGIILYILLWLVVPAEPSDPGTRTVANEAIKRNADEIKVKAEQWANDARHFSRNENSKVWAGWLILGVGVVFLLNNFGIFSFSFGKLWPLVLIVIGVMVLMRDKD